MKRIIVVLAAFLVLVSGAVTVGAISGEREVWNTSSSQSSEDTFAEECIAEDMAIADYVTNQGRPALSVE